MVTVIRKFRTLVKAEELKSSEFVLGRISGIMETLCGGKSYAIRLYRNGDAIFTTECSEFKYEFFRKTIEQKYPDMCIFDFE